ncbi:MAG TPA: YjgN family protein [Roseateles sp.]|nr:YjgN family protein [Roseateles sp.]
MNIEQAGAFEDLPQVQPRALYIRFTGSGSEYFRIWIVNLLLSLVTLGLYLPFAKARRLRYFYSNTLVDDQALAFHGDPWKMFRGFLLLALLTGAYALSGQFSPTAGLIAFLILCAIWPALWRSGLQFRLANTSWRGLRLRFEGSLGGAYAALLPTYLPALLLVLGTALLAPDGPAQRPGTAGLTLMGLGAGLMLLLVPLTTAMIKQYQHGNYALAKQRSRLELGVGRFYLLAVKLLLWCLAYGALLSLAIGFGGLLRGASRFWMLAVPVLSYLILYALATPYLVASLQNMVWGATRSPALRFHSALRLPGFTLLTVKNLLLTGLTLGLYRPFAAVSSARMRLEAVTLQAEGDLDDWAARQALTQPDAAGDAAGDFFGIDMGL